MRSPLPDNEDPDDLDCDPGHYNSAFWTRVWAALGLGTYAPTQGTHRRNRKRIVAGEREWADMSVPGPPSAELWSVFWPGFTSIGQTNYFEESAEYQEQNLLHFDAIRWHKEVIHRGETVDDYLARGGKIRKLGTQRGKNVLRKFNDYIFGLSSKN